MQINELLDRYIQQAEKLEIKLERLLAKDSKTANDQQRIGIIQGQLMTIDIVIDDLMLLDTASDNTRFSKLLNTLKQRRINNVY